MLLADFLESIFFLKISQICVTCSWEMLGFRILVTLVEFLTLPPTKRLQWSSMHIDITTTYILHIYNNHTHPHGHAKPEPWNISQKSLIFWNFIQPTENVYLKKIISTTFTALLYSLFTFYVGGKKKSHWWCRGLNAHQNSSTKYDTLDVNGFKMLFICLTHSIFTLFPTATAPQLTHVLVLLNWWHLTG